MKSQSSSVFRRLAQLLCMTFLLGVSSESFAAFSFSTNFESEVKDLSYQRNAPKTPFKNNVYLWAVSEDEMTNGFFTTLKSLINNGNVVKRSLTEVVLVVAGELTIGTDNRFVVMHMRADFDINGDVREAYPVSFSQNFILKDQPSSAEILEIINALTYDPGKWNEFRISKPVFSVRWGVADAKLYVNCVPYKQVYYKKSNNKSGKGKGPTIVSPCPGDASKFNLYDFQDRRPYNEFDNASLTSNIPVRGSDWRLHIFNVDSGNASLLLCPVAAGGSREAVIFDGGVSDDGTYDYVNGKYRAVVRMSELLRKESIDSVHLVISHSDNDHVSLLPDILGLPEVGSRLNHVYIGAPIGNLSENLRDRILKNANTVWDGARNSADENSGIPNLVAQRRERGVIGAALPYKKGRFSSDTTLIDHNWATATHDLSTICGGVVTFLAANELIDALAPYGGGTPSNRRSIVANIAGKVVLTADATAPALRRAVSNADAPPVVLTVPHHGSERTSHFPLEWTNWAKPRYLVYQAGSEHGHPSRSSFLGSIVRAPDPMFTGYQGATTAILPHSATKEVFFAANGGGLHDNVKIPQTTNKQVFITSDSGELVISPVGAGVDIKCLGPFGAGVGGGRRQKSATDVTAPDFAQMAANHAHCTP